MTLDQVAERTGRSVVLLRRWAREGRIPATRAGRIYLVAEADLQFIEAMPRTPGRRPAGQSKAAPEAWTFTERVDDFLALAAQIDGLRLAKTGIDLGATFRWERGAETTGTLAAMDNDDFRSFLLAWRQLVMRSEPTHLPTILALCADHLTHPKLRELAALVRESLDQVNRNDFDGSRPVSTFTYGEKVYSPWDVADLFMHGAVFHRRDRTKRAILESLAPGALAQVEWSFRVYIDDVLRAMQDTRLILLKAKEKDAVSDAPIP